jgi:hypothetical protein
MRKSFKYLYKKDGLRRPKPKAQQGMVEKPPSHTQQTKKPASITQKSQKSAHQ